MKTSILSKVAFRSILSHKRIFFPYLLSIISLFSLEYVLLSLMQNDYVNEFHPDFGTLLAIGVFFSTLLIIIITLYTSNFIQKNQTKEFGLYSVLGLEKSHIRFVMIVQNIFTWVVTSVFSVSLGYLFGNLIFIALNRMMLDTGATLMNYPFQIESALGVVLLILATLFISFALNAFKLMRLNPIELLQSAHEGEGEPKGRVWLAIIGLLSLSGGYYIALTTNDVLSSLFNIFIAIFLIMIGTYLLFISLSIIILKAMKKNKTFYYKPNNFLSISGMLDRMNNNAVSLASIAILSSGVILVLGLTTSLYRVMGTQVANSMPTDYSVQPFLEDKNENEAYLTNVMNELGEYGDIEEPLIHSNVSTNGYFIDQQLIPFSIDKEVDSTGQPFLLLAETIETYNELNDSSIQLDENDVAITSNVLTIDTSSIEVDGEMYETVPVSDEVIPSNYGVEVIYLAFSNEEHLESFRNDFQTPRGKDQEYMPSSYQTVLYFDVAGNEAAIQEYLNDLEEQDPLRVSHIEEVSQNLYTLYGGLLFIGLTVSIVLIIGTILMLYFKQITEGYQDRESYKIMKQVGLPDSMIKKTIQSQIIWVFALPVAIAILHNVFVSKIAYTLIGLIGVRSLSVFATSYTGVIVVFILVYLLFYWLTSKTYYDIINE